MKRRYEVVRDYPLPSQIQHVPEWGVIPSWDKTRVLHWYWNLWDAGAKAAKLNAREDQPA